MGKLVKILTSILISSLLAFITLILITFALFQNSTFRNYVIHYATTQVHQSTGWEIQLEDVEGLLPLQIKAKHLVVTSPEQQQISIDQIHLVISPWNLLRGQITFHLAELHQVKAHFPSSNNAFVSPEHRLSSLQTEPQLDSLSSLLPFRLKIDQLSISQLNLNSQPSSYNIQGSIDIHPTREFLQIDLAASNPESSLQPNQFHLFLHRDLDEITALFHVFEPSGGLLSHFLDKIPQGTFEISGKVNGPLQAWKNTLLKKEDLDKNNNRLSGNFSLEINLHDSPYTIYSEGDLAISPNWAFELKDLATHIFPLNHPSQDLFSLHGSIKVNPDLMIQQSNFLLSATDLSLFKTHDSLPLQGSLKGNLRFYNHLLTPNLSLKIESPQLQFNHQEFNKAIILAELRADEKSIQGDVRTSFQVEQIPCQGQASFVWDRNTTLSLPDFHFETTHQVLEGHLDISLDQAIAQGSVDWNALDLTELSPFLDHKIGGASQIRVHLEHHLNPSTNQIEQAVNLKLQGMQLIFGQAKFSELIVDHRFFIPSLFAKEIPNGQLNVTLKNLSLGSWEVYQLNFATAIDTAQAFWPYQFSIQDNIAKTFYAESEGNWHLSQSFKPRGLFEDLSLTVQQFKGVLAQQEFSLQQPLTLTINSQEIELSPFNFTLGKGVLSGDIDLSSDRLEMQWKAKGIPLELINLVNADVPLSGTMNAEAYLHGVPEELLGELQIDFIGVKLDSKTFSKLPPIEGSFKAQLLHEQLETSGSLKGIGSLPMTFDTKIPFKLALNPLVAKIDLDKSISAHVNLEGEVSPLVQFLMKDTTSITGHAKSSLSISGTFAQPIVAGQVELINGSCESLISGAVLKDVYMKMVGQGDRLEIVQLTGNDGAEGTISAHGEMKFDSLKKFPFEIAIDIQNARLLHLDYAHTTASGQLLYHGNLDKEILEGKLTVDQATIRIPEEVPAKMHNIEVTYINHSLDEREPTYYKKKNIVLRPVDLNLTLDIPQNAKLIGKNLSSEWRGSIEITGTDEDPILNGKLKLRKGDYQFHGKAFDLKEGLITFAGDPANKTSLHVTAAQEIDTVKIEVIMKGPIKKPAISFRSNPPMSQKEILSWILFNRGTSDITATENAQLSQSIVTLSGGEATNLLGKIRRSFGIDRIDISSRNTSEANEVSLRVGKYISKGLFLSVNKGINSEGNQISIEANLTRNIKAQAEVGDDAEGKMILKWQKDY